MELAKKHYEIEEVTEEYFVAWRNGHSRSLKAFRELRSIERMMGRSPDKYRELTGVAISAVTKSRLLRLFS